MLAFKKPKAKVKLGCERYAVDMSSGPMVKEPSAMDQSGFGLLLVEAGSRQFIVQALDFLCQEQSPD